MNRSAEQTNRVNREAVLVRFVCSALRFISHEPRKKDTHSLYLQCLQQRFLLKFSEQSKKFKFPSEIGNLTLFPDKSQNSAWINGEKGDLSCMFFNSHFNSNNINSSLELNYMNFFYINEILSHHEYTECRAAECLRSNQSEYWSEDANYKNRTLTLALLRNWVSSASF